MSIVKSITILSVFLFFILPSYACDVCGCAVSHNIYPSDNLTLLGFNYRLSSFEGTHLEYNEELFFKERYQRYDLVFKYAYKNRLELIGNIPYSIFTQKQNNIKKDDIQGISDLNVLVRYALINKIGNENHRLSVGVGVDFPTGKQAIKSYDGVVKYNFQPSNGTFNYLLNANYGYKKNNWGVLHSLSYKLNGTNKHGYNRGNSFNATLETFYQKKVNTWKLIPKLQFIYEHADRNNLQGIQYSLNTKRDFTVLGAGLDVYVANFYCSVAYQIPVWQSLETYQLKNKNRISVSLNYILN